MELNIILDIKKDEKKHDFLINNSNYYILLNRNPSNYKMFLDDYKKYKRNNNINKINDTLDNIEMIGNIVNLN